MRPELPPPLDNPFEALPRVPESKGVQAAAEAAAAAAEQVRAVECDVEGSLCAVSVHACVWGGGQELSEGLLGPTGAFMLYG